MTSRHFLNALQIYSISKLPKDYRMINRQRCFVITLTFSSPKWTITAKILLILQNSTIMIIALSITSSYSLPHYLWTLPVIQTIINRSLSEARVQACLKQAIVSSMLIKPDLVNIPKYYRPVVNLPYFGKLLEKAAHIEINKSFESANKPMHSTRLHLYG